MPIRKGLPTKYVLLLLRRICVIKRVYSQQCPNQLRYTSNSSPHRARTGTIRENTTISVGRKHFRLGYHADFPFPGGNLNLSMSRIYLMRYKPGGSGGSGGGVKRASECESMTTRTINHNNLVRDPRLLRARIPVLRLYIFILHTPPSPESPLGVVRCQHDHDQHRD